jgi:hypothetical protein
VLREIEAIADRVARKLARGGQEGSFTVQPGVSVIVIWRGARRDRVDAERALIAALGPYEAESMPGLGVVVSGRAPRALDHEQCTLSEEPDDSTVRECDLYEFIDDAAE